MIFERREELPRFTELEADYEILGELGRGTTAVVYLARERGLDRKVAIKVIRATYVEDEVAAARLMREARTVAALQHPNIVMLYGTRRLRDDSLALVMQYVEGRTLKTEVQENGPLGFARTAQILRQIGSALAYAHRHRIVHRDIKPENIYLDAETGLARLSDFGNARPWDADSGLTLPGSMLGTPAYMSPEQIDGGELDGRSDIYSLGLVGYEMLTGARPWASETMVSIIYKQKYEELLPVAVVRPGTPPPLLQAIEGAIRKRADERWQDAAAFLRVLRGQTIPAAYAQSATIAESEPSPPVEMLLQLREPELRQARPTTPIADRVTSPPVEVSLQLREPGLRQATPNPPPAPDITIRPERDTTGPAPDTDSRKQREENRQLQQTTSHTLTRTMFATTRPRPRRGLAAAVAAALVVGAAATLAFSGVGEALPGSVGAAVTAAVEAVSAPETAEQSTPEPATAAAVDMRSSDEQTDGQTDVEGETSPPGLTHLTALSTTELRGTAGAATQLAVVVEDDRGTPVSGAEVRFAVRTGAGQVTPEAALTGADGIARAEWILGSTLTQRAVATLSHDPDVRVVFTATAAPASVAGPVASQQAGVFINEVEVSAEQLDELQLIYGCPPPPGRYWYDSQSGLFGAWGYETAGYIRPSHQFRPLPANASNGNSGVFINGREINLTEAQFFQRILGAVYQGHRWWLDSNGNVGLEGNPTPVAKVVAELQHAGVDDGYRWRDDISRSGADGGCIWVKMPA